MPHEKALRVPVPKIRLLFSCPFVSLFPLRAAQVRFLSCLAPPPAQAVWHGTVSPLVLRAVETLLSRKHHFCVPVFCLLSVRAFTRVSSNSRQALKHCASECARVRGSDCLHALVVHVAVLRSRGPALAVRPQRLSPGVCRVSWPTPQACTDRTRALLPPDASPSRPRRRCAADGAVPGALPSRGKSTPGQARVDMVYGRVREAAPRHGHSSVQPAPDLLPLRIPRSHRCPVRAFRSTPATVVQCRASAGCADTRGACACGWPGVV
ncbi:hypothetical protein, conserved in T. vivax [Trypanosoma vivax Y486]|uniref:Uncharacterized protein n=1 Tax=Trypanosoma vivax (strain Y486) TaxID=1055687 RepID=F9WNH5_TRYVY|nr:hypothetical protein, conserved in T. vivax [Trypanosoma vivax Y486]|eukprot:CCD19093.1 hypothetical protein, conserved in T. vivax [Trypanosoma vivax Y486]